MNKQRQGRIDTELQRAIGKIISEDVKDPRLGFVTVTGVQVTPDLRFAKVLVSIIGDRHVARQSMEALNSAAKFIRHEVGEAVDLRYTPELNFVEDRSTERAIALGKVIDGAAGAVPAVPVPGSADDR